MKKVVLLDGGMGQELLKRSKLPAHPLWSAHVMMNEPEIVEKLHIDFIKAGARVITLNTYTATPERLERDGAEGMFSELQDKAIELANRARDFCNISNVRIAGCLPPLYGSYKPESTPPLEECIERYQIISHKQAPHIDLFICETMSSIKEAEAAITATKAHNIETWCSMTVADQGKSKLRSTESFENAVSYLNKFDHQANLINCSTPESTSISLKVLKNGNKPFGAFANGFTSIDALELGGTVDVLKARNDLGPEAYSKYVLDWINTGASIIGGCCEISPAHIKHIYKNLKDLDYDIVSSLES